MTLLDQEVDDLHPPSDADPWFTETAWYSFWDVEHRHIGHVYLRFRPNTGVADANVYVWDRGASLPWDAVYWKQLQMAYPPSLTTLTFPGGLEHAVVDPLVTYTLRFRDDSAPRDGVSVVSGVFALELTVERGGPPRWFGRKHFDQPMRVTGGLTVDGTRYDVDCRAMRDRSWYSRSDFGQFRSAYSYLLADDLEVLLLSAYPRGTHPLVAQLPVVGGYVRTDGGADLAVQGGRREVLSRDPDTGRPQEVALTAELSDNSTLTLRGTCHNGLAIACNTAMLSWMSFVEWHQIDHAGAARAGTVFGEDQEIWSPAIWRTFRRSLQHGPSTVSADVRGA